MTSTSDNDIGTSPYEGHQLVFITNHNFSGLIQRVKPDEFGFDTKFLAKSGARRALSVHEVNFLYWLKQAHKNGDFELERYARVYNDDTEKKWKVAPSWHSTNTQTASDCLPIIKK